MDVILVIFLSCHHLSVVFYGFDLLVVAGVVDGLVLSAFRQACRSLLRTAIDDQHLGCSATRVYGVVALLSFKPILSLKFPLYAIGMYLSIRGHTAKTFTTPRFVR